MPNIKPISDLRNYNEVLRDVAVGSPVFLTKNGRGKYAIVDILDYEKVGGKNVRILLPYFIAKNNYKEACEKDIPISFIAHFENLHHHPFLKRIV